LSDDRSTLRNEKKDDRFTEVPDVCDTPVLDVSTFVALDAAERTSESVSACTLLLLLLLLLLLMIVISLPYVTDKGIASI
jgi:hypothetical protein